MSVLQKGMKGEAVRDWQTMLIKAGYSLPRFGIDGDFGSETEAATMQFQRDMGALVDGKVGRETLHAMQELFGLASRENRPSAGNLDSSRAVVAAASEISSVAAQVSTQPKKAGISGTLLLLLGAFWLLSKRKR